MRVVNPGLNWLAHPYLYMDDTVIESEEVVQKLLEEGYQEVYIDPSRSEQVPPPAPMMAEDQSIVGLLGASSVKARFPIGEEMLFATSVHDDSVKYVRGFMRDIRSGKLNMAPAAAILERIVDSLERNADALISLSRLRRTDSYTYAHCVNVAVLTALSAQHQGKSRDQVFAYGMAGLFHDLGKSLIPPAVLNAPRKLNKVERALMKEHPRKGYEQLLKTPGIRTEVLQGVLYHHEKYNGSGYPQGLTGNEVPEIGFAVGVADIYDAMTSKRVYKEALFPHRALSIMYKMSDKELPSNVLIRFIRMMGVYPVGSVVEMNDGSRGVVSMSNPAQPVKPVVSLVRDPLGEPMPMQVCDLAAANCGLEIRRCIEPEAANIDPARVLALSSS